jgi:hypothetical protein
LKLPTRHNCLECNNQYAEFKQSQSNCLSIHEHLNYQPNNMDQCIKNKGVHDWLGKHVHDQNWADHDEEKEYVRQEGQRCLGGLTRCQKRRVQCLRNLNISSCRYQGL